MTAPPATNHRPDSPAPERAGLGAARAAALCAPALAIGAATTAGALGPWTSGAVWVPYAAVVALVAARRARRPFVAAAGIGLVAVAVATLVEALRVNALLANNAWIAERFADRPVAFVRYQVLMRVPFVGLATAALFGAMAALLARARGGATGKAHQ